MEVSPLLERTIGTLLHKIAVVNRRCTQNSVNRFLRDSSRIGHATNGSRARPVSSKGYGIEAQLLSWCRDGGSNPDEPKPGGF